jgi:hypothetical protein
MGTFIVPAVNWLWKTDLPASAVRPRPKSTGHRPRKREPASLPSDQFARTRCVVAAAEAGNLSLGGIISQAIAGGAGGAILTAVIGAIKNKAAA